MNKCDTKSTQDSKVTFIVDTREKLPYKFSENVNIKRKKLVVGDYSIEGLEPFFAVERKTLDDFLHSITHARERFFNELKHLRRIICCVVVEANWEDIVNGKYDSKVSPSSVMGTVCVITSKFGIPIYFLSNRQHAQIWLEKYMINIAGINECSETEES